MLKCYSNNQVTLYLKANSWIRHSSKSLTIKWQSETIITYMVFNNFIVCCGAESTKITCLIQSADTWMSECAMLMHLGFMWLSRSLTLSTLQVIQFKRCKVLDSMSSSDNENQHLACMKRAHVLYWEQNPLTER